LTPRFRCSCTTPRSRGSQLLKAEVWIVEVGSEKRLAFTFTKLSTTTDKVKSLRRLFPQAFRLRGFSRVLQEFLCLWVRGGGIELHIDEFSLILNGWFGVYTGEINWDRTVLRDDLCRSDPTLPTAKRAQSGMVTAGG
jgi:hypothetical protein